MIPKKIIVFLKEVNFKDTLNKVEESAYKREHGLHNNKAYKNYRKFIKAAPFSNYEIFWCDFGKYENGILISYFIIIILALLFEIFSLLIHTGKLKFEINKNIFRKIMICIINTFTTIGLIYFFILLYLFILSIIVVSNPPLE